MTETLLLEYITMTHDTKPQKVVTRFAPSPTGFLHLGGARTALYDWLYTRKNNGKFILRIEDTDVVRSTEESTQGIIDGMKWLGLNWDEGPYFQSQRLHIYNEHLDKLYRDGWVYPAFETQEELEAMRAKAMAEKRNPIYDRASLRLPPEEVERRMNSGVPFVWRFKVPDDGYTIVDELLMGGDETKVKNSTIGDFIITRPGTKDKPGMPLYNFVCAVDDVLMEITHVFRGIEHLTNASRQVLIQKALGHTPPKFVHLPVITKNGKKMSKRDPDAAGVFPVSVMARKELGYLPEATLNHVVLLGWSHPEGKEIMDAEEMIRAFSLERLNRANPNFDEKKYFHFNSHYIMQKSEAELAELILPFMEKARIDVKKFDMGTLGKMAAMERKRCKILSEFPEALRFFFEAPATYDEAGWQKTFDQDQAAAKKALSEVIVRLEKVEPFDKASIDAALHELVNITGLELKHLGPILRLALTGRTVSPGLSEMMEVMGKEEVVKRFEKVVGRLK